MNTRLSISLTLLITLFSIALSAAWANGNEPGSTITTVTLRSTVRLKAEESGISLGDLAIIIGPQAEPLQLLTVDSNQTIEPGHWATISIDTITTLIDDSPGINSGSVIIEGSDISITRRRDPSSHSSTTAITSKASTYEGPVLRDHIKRWIFTRLGTAQETTRIRFDPRNQALLDIPTAERVIEITQTGRSTKMHLRVIIYQGDRIISDSALRIDAQVQRTVRVASQRIKRGEMIDDQMSSLALRWISPNMPIADPARSIGLESKTTINPGEILISPMLVKPVLIKRGQLVSAKSLVGRAIVTKIVRAKSNGKLGDLIELESKDRTAHFTARVAGPGRVVIVQSPQSTD